MTLEQTIAKLAETFKAELISAIQRETPDKGVGGRVGRKGAGARAAKLADTFAAELISAAQRATVDKGAGGRVGRKNAPARAAHAPAAPRRGRKSSLSEADLQKNVKAILGALKRKKNGVRSEELRAALGFEKPQLLKAIKAAFDQGVIYKQGEKRKTVYFAK